MDESVPNLVPEEPRKNWSMLPFVLILVLAFVGSGFYVWQKNAVVVQPVLETDSTSNWETYTNEEYGFEFRA